MIISLSRSWLRRMKLFVLMMMTTAIINSSKKYIFEKVLQQATASVWREKMSEESKVRNYCSHTTTHPQNTPKFSTFRFFSSHLPIFLGIAGCPMQRQRRSEANAARKKTIKTVKETSPPGVQVITTSNTISLNEMLKEHFHRELHLHQVERVEPVQSDVHRVRPGAPR